MCAMKSIYPSPNFNCATVEVWEWINNFILHFSADVIVDKAVGLTINDTMNTTEQQNKSACTVFQIYRIFGALYVIPAGASVYCRDTKKI